jgi:site-specific recombinase
MMIVQNGMSRRMVLMNHIAWNVNQMMTRVQIFVHLAAKKAVLLIGVVNVIVKFVITIFKGVKYGE